MASSHPVVIVTGSAGMLGSPTCLRLADAGYEVFAFDRVGLPEPPKHHPQVHDIEFDVTDFAVVRSAFEEVRRRSGQKIASVVHLAAYYDFSGAESKLYEQVTVHGTDRILNALSSFELEQFLFSSTMLVHEPRPIGEFIHEDDPLVAKWPYPESKIRTEQLIRDGHPSVNSVILRMAGVYTEWGRQPTLAQQIKRIYERDLQSHVFPGDLDAGQSSMHLDDAVESIFLAVEKRNTLDKGMPILIGEADPPSYRELQSAIGQMIHGKAWTTLEVPAALAKVGAGVIDKATGGKAFIKPFMIEMADDHYALDIRRARERLGWIPKYDLRSYLQVIIDNLLADPDRWYRENQLER